MTGFVSKTEARSVQPFRYNTGAMQCDAYASSDKSLAL